MLVITVIVTVLMVIVTTKVTNLSSRQWSV